MRYVVIAGANLTLAEGQEEFETIRVREAQQVLAMPDGSQRLVPGMTLELKPDADDINTLREGGSIFVNILGTAWPPISVTTYDPTLIAAPKGNA